MASDYSSCSTFYRIYVVALILGASILATIDRSLLMVMVEPIKREFHLSDSAVGFLAGIAFSAPNALLMLPVAVLGDRYNRVRLVAGLLAIWSSFTALTGLAGSFLHLLIARAAVGGAESGAPPLFTSLISDIFPKNQRGTAISILYLATPLGLLSGLALGGWLAGEFGWRGAFFVVGIPGLVLALLLALTVREPMRERVVEAQAASGSAHPSGSINMMRSIGAVLQTVRRSHILLLLLLAFGFNMSAQASGFIFLTPYFMRTYNLEVHTAGPLLAVTYGVGMTIGMMSGGLVADFIRKHWPGRELGFVGRANFLVAVLGASAFLVQDWTLALVLIAFYAAGTVFHYGVTISTFVNNTPTAQRTGATSLLFLVGNLFGAGLGPLVTGMISDAAQALGAANPLQVALVAASSLYATGGAALILCGRAVACSDVATRTD